MSQIMEFLVDELRRFSSNLYARILNFNQIDVHILSVDIKIAQFVVFVCIHVFVI